LVIAALAGLAVLAATACTDDPSPGGGGAAADGGLTIAVDLPFQGGARDVSDDTWDALNLYLEQVGGAVGGRPVVLTKRDNSTAPKGTWNESSCARNAQAHVDTAGQVAVIGTYNSGCTKVELPLLNTADGGPMLMVSHANTSAGLTGPGVEGEPGKYFPSGQRNFARVIATEVVQGTAAAQFAADSLTVRRCLVLNDGEPYGIAVAGAFAEEARRRGIEVVGEESWSRADENYVALFGRAAVARPDCLYLGGQFDSNGARLIVDKVAVLGDNAAVKLLAPDGFVGYPDLTALPQAAGAYLTFPGLPTSVVTAQSPAAAKFVADFAARYGHEPRGDYAAYALYAVQALQVVLAAIERSDGTRQRVRDAVFTGTGVTVPAATAMLGRDVSIDPATGDVSGRDVSVQLVQDNQAVMHTPWAVI
jgi:branched-chain amino acid transport system substrate-binding protein